MTGHLGTRRPEVLQHAETVHARHHDVKDNEIRIRLRDSGEGGLAVVGGHRLEAVETQRRRHQVGDVLLVVNDQDTSLGRGGGGHGHSLALDWLCPA